MLNQTLRIISESIVETGLVCLKKSRKKFALCDHAIVAYRDLLKTNKRGRPE